MKKNKNYNYLIELEKTKQIKFITNAVISLTNNKDLLKFLKMNKKQHEHEIKIVKKIIQMFKKVWHPL